MPLLPQGTNANILGNFKGRLVDWMDGANIPDRGPHTARPERYGCTITQDYKHQDCRTDIKKGMMGSCLGQAKNGYAKIFIRGITESFQNGVWVENCWVPQEIVQKGKPWSADISDWHFKMSLKGTKLHGEVSKSNSADTSILGETITGLLNEFVENPAPFMGTKIQDLLNKRGSLKKGSTIDSLVAVIIQGIKNAGLYDTLNEPDFTDDDISLNAKHHIDPNFMGEMGGVYARFHRSTPAVQYWAKRTKYIYVGKTVDFRDRYLHHPSSTSSYGDLTRNSDSLIMLALCVMSDADNVDFAYLVEQVFVCLFQSYKKDICISLAAEIESKRGIKHVEAIEAANYFYIVSNKVFATTKFPGAVQRHSFNVAQGANYSMPFKEWVQLNDQNLFLRHDTFFKDRNTGYSMPMTVFRLAKPKIAHYRRMNESRKTYVLLVIHKAHEGKSFFSAGHSQTILDGTMGPREDDPYQLVLEVRTDGGAHPYGWSRTCSIGAFQNWDQGRALAVRIEWEHPPKSGQWKHKYLSTNRVYAYDDPKVVGSHSAYIKTIAMIRWLFDAPENKFQPWIPRLRGCAYVLETIYNYHTQTIHIGPQRPFTMRSGATVTIDSIIQSMQRLGLDNVDVTFRQNAKCDTCTILSTKNMARMGSECVQLPGKNCCWTCMLVGRPVCSWTKSGAIKSSVQFSHGKISGTVTAKHITKLPPADVALHKKYAAGLICQPDFTEVTGETFTQKPLELLNLSAQEDDLSDVEDEVDAIEDGDGDDDDDEDDE
jgi:hypothetical protein